MVGTQHISNKALTLNNIPNPEGENETNNNSNLCSQQDFYVIILLYDINQLVKPNVWDSKVHPISIFRTMKFFEIHIKNIFTSLLHIENYIRTRKINNGNVNDIPELNGFGKTA